MIFSIANISPRNCAGLLLKRIIMFSFPPRAARQAGSCSEPLSAGAKNCVGGPHAGESPGWGPRSLPPAASPPYCGAAWITTPSACPAAAPAPIMVWSVSFSSNVHTAAWTGRRRAGFRSTPRWGEHHPGGGRWCVPGGHGQRDQTHSEQTPAHP